MCIYTYIAIYIYTTRFAVFTCYDLFLWVFDVQNTKAKMLRAKPYATCLSQALRVIVPNYILGPSNCIASSGLARGMGPVGNNRLIMGW